jgi:hypothetical protein
MSYRLLNHAYTFQWNNKTLSEVMIALLTHIALHSFFFFASLASMKRVLVADDLRATPDYYIAKNDIFSLYLLLSASFSCLPRSHFSGNE